MSLAFFILIYIIICIAAWPLPVINYLVVVILAAGCFAIGNFSDILS